MPASAAVPTVDSLSSPGLGASAAAGVLAGARPVPASINLPPPTVPPPASLWRLVAPYCWQYRWSLLLCVFLNALPGLAIAIQAFAPAYLMRYVLKATDLSTTTRYVRLGELVGGYIFAAVVLRMFAWYGSYRIFTHVRENILMDLRSRFFRHINGLCLRFHGKYSSGELFTYVMGSPLTEISGFFHALAINAPNAISTFLIAVVWMSGWDWGMTLILVVSVVLTVISSTTGHNRLRALMEDYQAAEGKVIGRVADIFRGNRDVKMYAIEEKMSATFEASADVLRQKVYDRDVKTHHVNMRQETVGIFCFVLVILVAAGRYMNGHLDEGQLFSFMGAFAVLQTPVLLMFQIKVFQGKAQASLNRLNDVLMTDTTTPEPRRAMPLPEKAALVLKDLEFRYSADRPVLRGITLTIPYGQRVALVGPSGSGKSTLAKMFLRLYDPDHGSVSFGHEDLRCCRTRDIRQRFGVVPQDPYFFQTSIRENLHIVCPHATEDRMRECCEMASIWGFVESLPEGLDTVIGEGGARLSGGQRQRLAIARAMLHSPDYFVFDEATSALDTVSERLVQDAFAHILPGRTAIFIAHRLSTVKDCDRIIVLDDGRIVQDGSFERLRSEPGLFQRMVESDDF